MPSRSPGTARTHAEADSGEDGAHLEPGQNTMGLGDVAARDRFEVLRRTTRDLLHVFGCLYVFRVPLFNKTSESVRGGLRPPLTLRPSLLVATIRRGAQHRAPD